MSCVIALHECSSIVRVRKDPLMAYMNKNKLMCLASVLAFIVSCGGGSNASDPSISSVIGDGSAANIFQNALIVTGANFTSVTNVDLNSTDTTDTFALTHSIDSDTQITATLPASLAAGNYEVAVSNSATTATFAVTILQGEPGMTIAAQFLCGTSGDLDPSGTTAKLGTFMGVTRFSDGSYFANCSGFLSDAGSSLEDESSFSAFFAASSTAVVSTGELFCPALYVTATYSIAANTVTYTNSIAISNFEVVACTQSFPFVSEI